MNPLCACERERHCIIEVNADSLNQERHCSERIEQEKCVKTAKLHNCFIIMGQKVSAFYNRCV